MVAALKEQAAKSSRFKPRRYLVYAAHERIQQETWKFEKCC